MRPESVTDRASSSGGAKKAKRVGKRAAVCKQCQRPLNGSAERNRGYCSECPVPYDEELFELLRSWRKDQADAQSVPAFVVFSDATLEALAEVKPTNRTSLQSINGIGQAKLEKYAEDLLRIIA
jgi:DNA helicase-2/ATP-dependent DNA helicase PcrA